MSATKSNDLGAMREQELKLGLFDGPLLEGSTSILHEFDTAVAMGEKTMESRQAAVVIDHVEERVGQKTFNVDNERDQLNNFFDIKIVRVGVPVGL